MKSVKCGRLALLLGLVYPFIVSMQVKAQELSPLLNRLDRLERDIKTLNFQASGINNRIVTEDKRTRDDSSESISNGAFPKYVASRLNQRMNNLEQDLRAGTGNMEMATHQLQKLTDRFDKLIGDIDYRLGVIEGALGLSGPPSLAGQFRGTNDVLQQGVPAVPSSVGAPTSVIASGTPSLGLGPTAANPQIKRTETDQTFGSLGTVSARAVGQMTVSKPVLPLGNRTSTGNAKQTVPATPGRSTGSSPSVVQSSPARTNTRILPLGSPREQYTYAFNLLRQTNYQQAEIALKQFVAENGDDPLAGNASYWLGETFYVRADYQQAAQVFFEAFQSNPKNRKAPDMLLKLGMSLEQLGKNTEACATFEKVAVDFGKAFPRIKNSLERERKRAACP